MAEWKPIFEHFQSKRATIDSIYASIPDLNPGRARTAKDFLEGFWRTIADDRMAKREISDQCQRLGM